MLRNQWEYYFQAIIYELGKPVIENCSDAVRTLLDLFWELYGMLEWEMLLIVNCLVNGIGELVFTQPISGYGDPWRNRSLDQFNRAKSSGLFLCVVYPLWDWVVLLHLMRGIDSRCFCLLPFESAVEQLHLSIMFITAMSSSFTVECVTP